MNTPHNHDHDHDPLEPPDPRTLRTLPPCAIVGARAEAVEHGYQTFQISFRDTIQEQLVPDPIDGSIRTTAASIPGLDILFEKLDEYGLLTVERTGPDGDPGPLFLTFSLDAKLDDLANELRDKQQFPQVERAILADGLPPAAAPTDPLVGVDDQLSNDPSTGLPRQWYHHRCGVPDAWKTTKGAGVVVADIDWGFATSHEELINRLDDCYNSYDGSKDVSQGSLTGHGTGVLGIVGAAMNERGIAGVAPEAALWAVQANTGKEEERIEGCPWERAIHWVCNNNSGGRRKVLLLERQAEDNFNIESVMTINNAIRYAIARGVIVVVTAGNGNTDAGLDRYGNKFHETGSILVGATSFGASDNPRAEFSNFSNRIVVSAPGDTQHDVTSGGEFEYSLCCLGGTSSAGAKVAGVVALMLSVNSRLAQQDVRDILRSSRKNVKTIRGRPAGRFLDAAAAVAAAATWVSTPPSAHAAGESD